MGEGEGGMIWENDIETCIISYKKRIASLGSMQDTGCLGLVHWDDPERWYGEPVLHETILTSDVSYPSWVLRPPSEVGGGGSGLGTHEESFYSSIPLTNKLYQVLF